MIHDEIGAKIGGKKPKMGYQTYLNEFYVPPGEGSDPFTYSPDPDAMLLAHNGWYCLIYDGNWVGFDAKGRAALSDYPPTMFYVERVGKHQITMRFADGSYLGVDGNPVDGAKTKAVSTPYIWNIYYENNDGGRGGNMYSLRPSTNTALALTVSGTVKEGTPVILSTQ